MRGGSGEQAGRGFGSSSAAGSPTRQMARSAAESTGFTPHNLSGSSQTSPKPSPTPALSREPPITVFGSALAAPSPTRAVARSPAGAGGTLVPIFPGTSTTPGAGPGA